MDVPELARAASRLRLVKGPADGVGGAPRSVGPMVVSVRGVDGLPTLARFVRRRESMGKAGDPPTINSPPGGEAAHTDAAAPLPDAAPVSFRFPRQDGAAARGRTKVKPPVAGGIEVVLASHLPAQPGPWVDQYAAQISERSGRGVGLLRLANGEARIDTFGGRSTAQVPANAHIREALASVGRWTSQWVIHAEEAEARRLAAMSEVSRVTVLVGANEPAVISAYRVLKSLAVERLDCTPRDALPDLRVAVMGVDEVEAERVAYTLRETAATFLDEHVELSACLHRLAPTSARTVFRGGCDVDAADLLPSLVHPAADPAAGAVLFADAPHASTDEPADAAEDAPPVAPDADWPDLASLLSLEPLGIEMPGDAGALFGVNDAGELHIAVHDDAAAGLMRMTAALAWAADHQALIAAAASPIEFTGAIVGDLIVERARDVLPLARTSLKLHVLTRVDTPSGGVWHTVELN